MAAFFLEKNQIKELYMDNRILGSLLMVITIIGTIAYALHVEGSRGWYSLFLSWPSFLVVFGGGTGMILMRKHTYQDNQLGKNLKREFILAGWIGFMIGLVLLSNGMQHHLFVGMKHELAQNLGPGLAAAIVPIFYGYVVGAIMESFFTRDVKLVLYNTSDEEE